MPFTTTTYRRPVPFWVVWCLEQDNYVCSNNPCGTCLPTRAYRLVLAVLAFAALCVGFTLGACYLSENSPQRTAAIALVVSGFVVMLFVECMEMSCVMTLPAYVGASSPSGQQQQQSQNASVSINLAPVFSQVNSNNTADTGPKSGLSQ